MAENEHSIIQYPKINHIKFYIVSIHYRYPHLHNAFELNLILQGSLKMKISEEVFVAHVGDLILVNANEVHELTAENANAVLLSMQISVNFCKEYFPTWSHTVFHHHFIRPDLNEVQEKRLKSLFCHAAVVYWSSESNQNYRCLALSCLVLEQLKLCLPQREMNYTESVSRQKNTMRLNRILSFIEQHYAERNILSKLAAQENVTLTYMSHFFHDNFHISFRDYLNIYRFEKAIYLLTTTNRSILDICIEVGFNDYKTFNQLCRKKYNCSTKECRKMTLQFSNSRIISDALTIQYMFSDKESIDYLANQYSSDDDSWKIVSAC